jgi:two-component system, cell cycle sensor histidine kinase and response regulator CckA
LRPFTEELRALRRSEARCRAIIENTADLIATVDLEERITEVNPAFERTLGYSREYLTGRSLAELTAPEWHGQLRDSTTVKLAGGRDRTMYDLELVAANGRRVPVEVTSWLIREDGEPVGIQAVCRDLSERKNDARALRESEERHRGLIQQLPLVTYVERPSQVPTSGSPLETVFMSPQIEELLGYPPEQWIGTDLWHDLVLPEDRDRLEHESDAAALRGDTFRSEYRMVAADGRTVWVLEVQVPVHDAAGALMHTQGFLIDITDRRAAEEALAESEERLRLLFEASPHGMEVLDLEGRILSVNSALAGMLGYTQEELLQLGFHDVIHPDDRELAESVFRDLVDGTQPFHSLEARYLPKDAAPRLAHVTVFSLPHPEVRPELAIGIVEDITNRRALEEQLRQTQRLEAVGQLAGGIAHDFNNLLTAITSYCDLAGRALGTNEERVAHSLEGIRGASDRAAELTQQLLAFSRRQVLKVEVLDLNAAVTECVPMLERLLDDDIEIRVALDPAALPVTMDGGQLAQALVNLAVNARDAMVDGGILTISTQNVTLDESPTTAGTVSGPHVMLAVGDTGCGMSADVLPRIFEPFFTTKEPGKGTGLGLASLIGIVEQSGGRVSVYSEPGVGTTFKLYLPASEDAAAPDPDVLEHPEARRGGDERILLVDDNDAVRSSVEEILEDLGYRVQAAAGPGEALRAAGGATEMDILVTDVVMLDMNGRQLADALLADAPEMKVLYMSGYTDDAVIARGVIEPGTAFLQKPFDADRLAHAIRTLLDS